MLIEDLALLIACGSALVIGVSFNAIGWSLRHPFPATARAGGPAHPL